MYSPLSSQRLVLIFGGLLLFQVSALAVALLLAPKFFPFSQRNLSVPEMRASVALATLVDESNPPASSLLPEEESLSSQALVGTTSETIAEPALNSVRVSPGDTLATIFSRLGAPHAGALAADQSLRTLDGPARALRIGETIEFLQDSSSEITLLRRVLPDGGVLTLEGNSAGGYKPTLVEVKVAEAPRTISGAISTSLSASASSLGLPFSVVDDFVDLFSNRIEFRRDMQPGDTFSVTYLERTNERTGEILRPGAITSASLTTSGKLLVAVQHADEKGSLRYFDEQGNPLGNYFLRYPVQFSRISSAFSYARFHPVLKRTRPHNGVDFAAPVGTPVRAVADGIVDFSGYNGGAGNMIKISHGSRWSTAYLHLHTISKEVRRGGRVSRGQVIGTVGSTGLSTGPHLHFSLYDNGKYVDPMKTALPAMDENVRPLPREYLMAALEAVRFEHQRVAQVQSASSAG